MRIDVTDTFSVELSTLNQREHLIVRSRDRMYDLSKFAKHHGAIADMAQRDLPDDKRVRNHITMIQER
jgi:hypothetical protein